MIRRYNGLKSKMIENLKDLSEFETLPRIYALDLIHDAYRIALRCHAQRMRQI